MLDILTKQSKNANFTCIYRKKTTFKSPKGRPTMPFGLSAECDKNINNTVIKNAICMKISGKKLPIETSYEIFNHKAFL